MDSQIFLFRIVIHSAVNWWFMCSFKEEIITYVKKVVRSQGCPVIFSLTLNSSSSADIFISKIPSSQRICLLLSYSFLRKCIIGSETAWSAEFRELFFKLCFLIDFEEKYGSQNMQDKNNIQPISEDFLPCFRFSEIMPKGQKKEPQKKKAKSLLRLSRKPCVR